SLHLLKKVLDSVGWILQTHNRLTTQVLSSVHYEQLQMSDEASVSLLCVQLWTHTCSSSRDFVSRLSDESVTLLLNDIIGQLAVSSEARVGGASVRLLLLLAGELRGRLPPLLRAFRGLDRLLSNDWRGRGFDQEVDQLIKIVQSSESSVSRQMNLYRRVRAACVIQAAWRSHTTRRRVQNLNRAVSTLQRKYRYWTGTGPGLGLGLGLDWVWTGTGPGLCCVCVCFRSRRQQQQKQQEARLCEETLRYQVSVNLRRHQARRKFHLKQRQLLQLLPPDQVSSYLCECERRAAVLIQTQFRGFRQRHKFKLHKEKEKERLRRNRAATVLQRAVRLFLERRRAAKVPPSSFWIGQKGLTDRRRAELKKQVEDYITLHPSGRVSLEECVFLHEEVQSLWASHCQSVVQTRREEQKINTLLAHTHTQLHTLR
ncbi:hypothetical protein NL108_017836, partial [Boleophthalmus pectinirostris]